LVKRKRIFIEASDVYVFSLCCVSISACEPLRFLLSRIIVLSVIVVFSSSLSLLLALLKKDGWWEWTRRERSEHNRGEGERDTDRKGNATLTRVNEEHVKEFEGSSKTTMLAVAVVNVVLASREYSMIALSCIVYACMCLGLSFFSCYCAYCYFCYISYFLILSYFNIFVSLHMHLYDL